MGQTETLRELLSRPGLLVVPGCYDALSARMVERAGFPAAYMSGFGTSASRAGLPDMGLLSFREMAGHAAALASAIRIPLIADADTGYGGPLNVRRTVLAYARAGVAGIQLEDQEWPKRCGHTEGKRVVSLDEALAKLRAALDARADSTGTDILIVARTDARAVHGFEAALERCQAFAEAGADVVFFEAPESREELARIAESVSAPLLVNQIEGGKTPLLAREELESLGYKVALYPLTLLFAAVAALSGRLERFGPWEGSPSFDQLKEVVGFSWHEQRLAKYERHGSPDAAPPEA